MLQPVTSCLYRVGVTVSTGDLVGYFFDFDLFERCNAEISEAFLRETISLSLIHSSFLYERLRPFAKGYIFLPFEDLVDPSLTES